VLLLVETRHDFGAVRQISSFCARTTGPSLFGCSGRRAPCYKRISAGKCDSHGHIPTVATLNRADPRNWLSKTRPCLSGRAHNSGWAPLPKLLVVRWDHREQASVAFGCRCLKNYKTLRCPSNFLALVLFFLLQPKFSPPHNTTASRTLPRCVNQTFPGEPASATIDKISFNINNNILPTQPPSALPSQVDLNYSTVLPSSSSSSPSTTAAIYGLDFPVFITDSQQSTWLPSSSTSLPAIPAHQQQPTQLPQQDFVLFDQPSRPTRHLHQPRRLVSQPPAIGVVTSHQQQHHYPQQQQQQLLGSPAVQNQRVANIIQATGHSTSSSAFNNNRFSSAQNQNQFYASSAPSSTVALARAHSRPPVPLFPQSTGNVPQQGKMFSGNSPSCPTTPWHPDLQAYPDLEDYTAFGGGYDMSRSASSSTNMGTISPSELLMSAPNSTALTALTSPSIYTPELSDSFDVSPSFEAADGWDHNPDNWPSLFPESTTGQPLVADQSPALGGIDAEQSATAHERRQSSNVSPKNSSRHSLVAGVNSRKRDKPLPPIVIDDPADTVAVKRARNTLAARKSRERKAAKMEELEAEIARLEADRDYWKTQALARGASDA
jgi:hypothetical protein